VAKRLRGFDCEVLYTRASGPLDDVPGYVALDTLLHRADVISLHLPLNADTHHLIDAGAIGKMRQGAVLINVARGSIVDQDALLEALHSGRLGGAGLDVFEPEPLPLDHPLRQAPTAVLTAHMAGGTRENLARIVSHWAGNILRHANGQGLEEADLVR
jgi:phosphoglycerate dehydrogenase-like enzyme